MWKILIWTLFTSEWLRWLAGLQIQGLGKSTAEQIDLIARRGTSDLHMCPQLDSIKCQELHFFAFQLCWPGGIRPPSFSNLQMREVRWMHDLYSNLICSCSMCRLDWIRDNSPALTSLQVCLKLGMAAWGSFGRSYTSGSVPNGEAGDQSQAKWLKRAGEGYIDCLIAW